MKRTMSIAQKSIDERLEMQANLVALQQTLELERQEFQQQIESLSENCVNLDTVEQLQRTIQQLRSECDQLTLRDSEIDRRCTRLQIDHDFAVDECRRLRQSLELLQSHEIGTDGFFKISMEQFRALIDILIQNEQRKRSELVALAQSNSMPFSVTNSDDQILRALESLSGLPHSQEQSSSHAQLQNLESELAQAQRLLRDAQTRLAEADERATIAAEQLGALRDRLMQSEDRCTAAAKEIQQWKSMYQQLLSAKSAVTASTTSTSNEMRALQQTVATKQQSIDELQKRIDALQAELVKNQSAVSTAAAPASTELPIVEIDTFVEQQRSVVPQQLSSPKSPVAPANERSLQIARELEAQVEMRRAQNQMLSSAKQQRSQPTPMFSPIGNGTTSGAYYQPTPQQMMALASDLAATPGIHPFEDLSTTVASLMQRHGLEQRSSMPLHHVPASSTIPVSVTVVPMTVAQPLSATAPPPAQSTYYDPHSVGLARAFPLLSPGHQPAGSKSQPAQQPQQPKPRSPPPQSSSPPNGPYLHLKYEAPASKEQRTRKQQRSFVQSPK